MGKWAGVSIGSNSIRLLVANTAPGEAPVPLVREEQVVRLASQITRQGRLSDDAISNVVSVVWRYQRAARRHGAELQRVVGTAAMRQAARVSSHVPGDLEGDARPPLGELDGLAAQMCRDPFVSPLVHGHPPGPSVREVRRSPH